MKNKLMKRLIVAVGIVGIIILILMIGTRFRKVPVTEADIPQTSSEIRDVVVDKPDESQTIEEEEKITVAPIDITEDAVEDNGSPDTKTEQKIQEDIPDKPTYTKEQLTDPTQEPNGEKVEVPKATPKATKADEKTNAKSDENITNDSSGGLPGFGEVPDGGDNQVIDGDSDGDIDKQVGTMD